VVLPEETIDGKTKGTDRTRGVSDIALAMFHCVTKNNRAYDGGLQTFRQTMFWNEESIR
jgi:hypothetical protein